MLSEFTKMKRRQKVFNYTLLTAEAPSDGNFSEERILPQQLQKLTFLDNGFGRKQNLRKKSFRTKTKVEKGSMYWLFRNYFPKEWTQFHLF